MLLDAVVTTQRTKKRSLAVAPTILATFYSRGRELWRATVTIELNLGSVKMNHNRPNI